MDLAVINVSRLPIGKQVWKRDAFSLIDSQCLRHRVWKPTELQTFWGSLRRRRGGRWELPPSATKIQGFILDTSGFNLIIV